MGELTEIVNSASPDQLKVLAAYAQYMGEAVPKYCNCPSKCNETCPIAKELGESFQLVAQRLSSL